MRVYEDDLIKYMCNGVSVVGNATSLFDREYGLIIEQKWLPFNKNKHTRAVNYLFVIKKL